MKTVVVRNINRADAAVVKRLGALGVATVHEAYGRSGLMKTYLRPVWAGGEAAGTAVTVLVHPGDNWMIHVAVEQCRPGDILVVGCSADNTDGMFGDLLATSLMARGVTGLVISPVAVFCPFDINSLHLQGLIHVVSQSPNSWPALLRLWRACAVLRGARRLRGVAARGDS
jgi:hypothetical protein